MVSVSPPCHLVVWVAVVPCLSAHHNRTVATALPPCPVVDLLAAAVPCLALVVLCLPNLAVVVLCLLHLAVVVLCLLNLAAVVPLANPAVTVLCNRLVLAAVRCPCPLIDFPQWEDPNTICDLIISIMSIPARLIRDPLKNRTIRRSFLMVPQDLLAPRHPDRAHTTCNLDLLVLPCQDLLDLPLDLVIHANLHPLV